MDEGIKLKARSEEEVREVMKKTLHLKENEEIEIRILKEPKKLLFISVQGLYEVIIIDKNERKFLKREEKKVEEKAEKITKQVKEKPRETRVREKEKVSQTKSLNEVKESKNVQNQPAGETKVKTDENETKIRAFLKEFLVNSKLNINIKNIYFKNGRYIVNLEGKDIRYLIGEKGTTLNSLEYILNTVIKNVKISIDSNGYKNKREESLRVLARKKGEKVQKTGVPIKLNSMSARERKIIHEEISFMKDLETQSVGEEPKRCLIIKKKR